MTAQIEFGKELQSLVAKHCGKLPPEIIVLQMASFLGQILDFDGFIVPKNQLEAHVMMFLNIKTAVSGNG